MFFKKKPRLGGRARSKVVGITCDDGLGPVLEQQFFGDDGLDHVLIRFRFLLHHGEWLLERLHFSVQDVMANDQNGHAILNGRKQVADVLVFERCVPAGFELTLHFQGGPFRR